MTSQHTILKTTRLRRSVRFVLGTLAACLLPMAAVNATAIAPEATAVRTSITEPTQSYLMSFHTCATGVTDCNNPSNHIVQLAQSADAISWSMVGGWQSYQGSVPDVFRRGNTIYVYSTSGLLRINIKTGVSTTSSVALSSGKYVDPSLAQLPDGRLILFYLPGIMGQDPAGCAPGEASCVRQIKSAVEDAGSDGTRFTVDNDARISETITNSFSDPDIFFNGKEWVLYVSRGPSVHAYTSTSLQGTYVFKSVVSNNIGGVPSGLQLADGSIVTFVHRSLGVTTEIQRATSTLGDSPISSFQTALTARSLGLGNYAESPGLALNTTGIACSSCSPSSSVTTTPSKTTTTTGSGSSKAKSTISCVKGKTAKKVTGVNPKCPAGYKKK